MSFCPTSSGAADGTLANDLFLLPDGAMQAGTYVLRDPGGTDLFDLLLDPTRPTFDGGGNGERQCAESPGSRAARGSCWRKAQRPAARRSTMC